MFKYKIFTLKSDIVDFYTLFILLLF